MELTRGDFLRSLAIGVGGAVTGLTAFGADGSQVPGLRWHSGRNETLLVDLTKETFERLLNTTFRVMDKSTPTVVDVQLVEVSEGRSASDFEQFSILFHGPAEPVLPQRTGDFDLFLVPVAASQSRAEYEAVFSRMNR
jgi:hypothetical protein